ncbi:hypothetical protein V6N12_040361 [Hibiscus sabdariffa]|uniref:Uncharacterized protein n=1 Tax=Hibiscus sabdariffa TaxID=183260 RepID=A0ABR2E719_9ROSI
MGIGDGSWCPAGNGMEWDTRLATSRQKTWQSFLYLVSSVFTFNPMLMQPLEICPNGLDHSKIHYLTSTWAVTVCEVLSTLESKWPPTSREALKIMEKALCGHICRNDRFFDCVLSIKTSIAGNSVEPVSEQCETWGKR